MIRFCKDKLLNVKVHFISSVQWYLRDYRVVPSLLFSLFKPNYKCLYVYESHSIRFFLPSPSQKFKCKTLKRLLWRFIEYFVNHTVLAEKELLEFFVRCIQFWEYPTRDTLLFYHVKERKNSIRNKRLH